MEDAIICSPNFIPDHSLFAVFDGHGGILLLLILRPRSR